MSLQQNAPPASPSLSLLVFATAAFVCGVLFGIWLSRRQEKEAYRVSELPIAVRQRLSGVLAKAQVLLSAPEADVAEVKPSGGTLPPVLAPPPSDVEHQVHEW